MPAKSRKVIQEISVSEFKAKCLSLIQQVQKTKAPIRLTKRGKPIAEVVPVSPKPTRAATGSARYRRSPRSPETSSLRSSIFKILRFTGIEAAPRYPRLGVERCRS